MKVAFVAHGSFFDPAPIHLKIHYTPILGLVARTYKHTDLTLVNILTASKIAYIDLPFRHVYIRVCVPDC